MILDGDNRSLPDREVSTEELHILRWTRYKAENYLVHPEALARFVKSASLDLFSESTAKQGLEFLKEQLPPTVYNNPLDEHDYLIATAASKKILPGFFKAAEVRLAKNEYYQIASQMLKNEIPNEVIEKLNSIAKNFEILNTS